jgi:hypothetical protein
MSGAVNIVGAPVSSGYVLVDNGPGSLPTFQSFTAAGGGAGLSAGTQSASTGTVAFANSNGVTFGMSLSSQITASVAAQSVQTQNCVDVSVGGNTTGTLALASSGTLLIAGGNNITLSQNGNSITISGPNAGGAQTGISGLQVSNTTYTSGTVTLQNANGISFGSSGANGISASYTVPTQTAFVLSNSNGVSFGTNGSTVTASYTVPSVVGLISAINVSAGTTSSNVSAITFSNANGVTFGFDGTNITASTAGGGGGGAAISAAGSSQNAGTVVFSNSNGFSFGMNGSTITASYTVPASSSLVGTNGISVSTNGSTISLSLVAPQRSFLQALPFDQSTVAQIGNGTIQVYPLFNPQPFTASRADVYASLSLSSSSNSSFAGVISLYVGLYTLTGGTLSQASTASQSFQFSNTSNSSFSVVTGVRNLTVPLGVNYTGFQDLWVAVMSKTASTNTNWYTASNVLVSYGPGSQIGLMNGVVTATQQLMPGMGQYSATSASLPASMALSLISGLGSGTAYNLLPPVNFLNATA